MTEQDSRSTRAADGDAAGGPRHRAPRRGCSFSPVVTLRGGAPLTHLLLRPGAAAVVAAAFLAGGATQVYREDVGQERRWVAEQAQAAQARAAARTELAQRARQQEAARARLTGEAAAFAAGVRNDALAAARTAVAAADSAVLVAAPVVSPDQLSPLDDAVARLTTLIEATPAPEPSAVPVPVSLVRPMLIDGAPADTGPAAPPASTAQEPAGAATPGSGAGALSAAALAGEAMTSAEIAGLPGPAALPSDAADRLLTDVVADGLPVTSTHVLVAPGLAAADAAALAGSALAAAVPEPPSQVLDVEPGLPSAAAPDRSTALDDRTARGGVDRTAAGPDADAGAAPSSDAAAAGEVDAQTRTDDPEVLDLAASAELVAAAEAVTALSGQVHAVAEANIAAAAAAAAAAAVAATAEAAELARKVEAVAQSPNGQIERELLCGVSFQDGVLLRCDAAAALDELNVAYRAHFGKDLSVSSSYRDHATQVLTKQLRGALAARPGTSNHGLGLAVDLDGFGGLGQFGLPTYRWMKENAAQFGWYHPAYMEPGGGGPQEPWHWEFGDL